MFGLIWFVQVVHYPLFNKVGSDVFVEYEKAHTLLTSFVVILPMCLEFVTSCLLLYSRPESMSEFQVWIGIALVFIIWGSTFFLQVPQHKTLSHGFNVKAHRFLVVSNWIRTIAWTSRAFLLIYVCKMCLDQ